MKVRIGFAVANVLGCEALAAALVCDDVAGADAEVR